MISFPHRSDMDAAVSSSLGVMGPLLRKLDLLLDPDYRLQERLKKAIRVLMDDLEEVWCILVELSTFLETPSRVECWIMEVRELSYYIDDGIDLMMSTRTDAESNKRSARSHRVGRVQVAWCPKIPKRSTRIWISRIVEFRTLLQEAIERHERFQIDAACSSSRHVISTEGPVPALYGDATNLIGIDDSKFKLIEMLTIKAEKQLKVVSLVGPAGVGKTTLANEIYRELGRQFDCKAFVRASRKTNMRSLLGNVLSQIMRHHQPPSNVGSAQNIIDNIKEHLKDKRYLIVIDNLWDIAAWDIMSSAFPQGKSCSRIIATTENIDVAHECCGYLPNNVLEMKPLSAQDSRKIFFRRVFRSEHQCPDKMKEISYGIIRKCCGLPLAIISIAGLLASQSHCLKLWHYVQDCLCIIANRIHTMEEIQREILNLTYNCLPHCLKTCLLYFSMYPEGFIIWKVHLVKQWIAEGFINPTDGKETDEVAENYFNELINRGMIQPLRIEHNEEVLSCTVHHIIHDLITHGSKRENFIDAMDYSETITGLSTKVRRLSLHFSNARYAKQPAGITMPQLRSLAFFGLPKCVPLFEEFKLLRVLILEFWGDHEGCTRLNLSRICRLFLLRYLKISSDIIVELPVQMQRLQYLETLEIDARLHDVPFDIVQLSSLLHLSLQGVTALPDGIGLIRSLTTLLHFDLGHNSEENVWSLRMLTNLRHLHLTCSEPLPHEKLKGMLIPVVSSLERFGNLKSLTLAPVALGTANFFDISDNISCPSIFLQRLELLPPVCFFSILPNSIGQFNKLRILKIVVRELPRNNINNLTGLPSLTILLLYIRTALKGTIVFKDMAFPALRYFKLKCSVMYLAFQAGAMPNLRRLKLCFNAIRGDSYVLLLSGVEHLRNLQEIAGRIGEAHGCHESKRRIVKSLFEDAISNHPRCPRLNIQWVDYFEEEYSSLENQHDRHEGLPGEHVVVEKESMEDINKTSSSRSVCGFNRLQWVDYFEEEYQSLENQHARHEGLPGQHVVVEKESMEDINRTSSSRFYEEYNLLPAYSSGQLKSGLHLSLLKDITNNFSVEQEIGRSDYGVVYKGMLRDGIVAVKRQYGWFATFPRQLEHVNLLREVQHNNIVQFLNCCWGPEDIFLCFEYLHNGSLRSKITDESCGLQWHTRYQIIKGICQGLHYLHERQIIHSGIKLENILLDSNMVPKISDYGYTVLLGEHGLIVPKKMFTSREYMPPEYIPDRTVVTVKSDIYSLGVIIMQIVSGCVHPNIESVFRGWRNRLQLDTLHKHTAFEESYHQVKMCIKIGIECMDHIPQNRPDTRDIIQSLGETRNTEQSVASSIKIRHQSFEDSIVSSAPSSSKGKGKHNHLGETNAFDEVVHRIRERFTHIILSESRMDDVLYKELEVLEGIVNGREKPGDLKLPLLQLITEKFADELKIAHGGCGLVYKGILPNGIIAVKKFFSHHTVDDHMFHAEVKSLMKVSHKNTVRFLGYCSLTEEKAIDMQGKIILAEVRERLLCLEYISNGSLEKHLTDELRGLDWQTRYQIFNGICEGLDHLHREKIKHMDLKPANILLDDNMVPKITDFGLSRLDDASQTMNEQRLLSFGYCAPEYRDYGKISRKADIYSLGVIILELVTGSKEKPSINKVLSRWKHRWKKSAKDISLLGSYEQVAKCLYLAEKCMHVDPVKRPEIWDIINDLKKMDSNEAHSHATWDMLGVEPLDIHLPIVLNKLISCSIELTNDTDDYIAFRITTTSIHKYNTHPNKDIVSPQSKHTVTIALQGLDKAPLHDHCRDQFSVQSTIVDKSMTAMDITDEMFNQEKSKVVDEVDLIVVLDMQPPGDQ